MYELQFPEIRTFASADRTTLLQILDLAIGELYMTLQTPNILSRKVTKPYKPPITVLEAVADLSEHYYLHAQNMIDYYEKYNIPRSASMKTALG